MSVRFLYGNAFGRMLLKAILHSKALPIAAKFVQSGLSKPMIGSYIRRNNIDMSDFEGQKFNSFGEFFARTKAVNLPTSKPSEVISPCDGLLSVFTINKKTQLHIKDSLYRIEDLIPEKETAELFNDGICLIFRLCASDYHHFCYVDDCTHIKSQFIQGQLHSVQPIACDTVPVYRLNRRQWTLFDTENFGKMAQIEIGAMLVGGIVHEKDEGTAVRGEEMGHFELAGSTIALLFTKDFKDNFSLYDNYKSSWNSGNEVRIKLGEIIGDVKSDAKISR